MVIDRQLTVIVYIYLYDMIWSTGGKGGLCFAREWTRNVVATDIVVGALSFLWMKWREAMLKLFLLLLFESLVYTCLVVGRRPGQDTRDAVVLWIGICSAEKKNQNWKRDRWMNDEWVKWIRESSLQFIRWQKARRPLFHWEEYFNNDGHHGLGTVEGDIPIIYRSSCLFHSCTRIQ